MDLDHLKMILNKKGIPWHKQGWRSENWLSVAACIFLGAGIALAIFRPLVAVENARYILSAVSQVLGTVFVLTIAVMQILGGAGHLLVNRFFKMWQFWFISSITLVGILLPLVVLYFDLLARGTPVTLGWAAANLILIGWFIWRFAPVQAMPGRLRTLKDDAIYSLKNQIPTLAADNLREITLVALEAFRNGEGKITRDSCNSIYYIAANDDATPEIKEISKKYLQALDDWIGGKKAEGLPERYIKSLLEKLN